MVGPKAGPGALLAMKCLAVRRRPPAVVAFPVASVRLSLQLVVSCRRASVGGGNAVIPRDGPPVARLEEAAHRPTALFAAWLMEAHRYWR